jgi:hypothetical protein
MMKYNFSLWFCRCNSNVKTLTDVDIRNVCIVFIVKRPIFDDPLSLHNQNTETFIVFLYSMQHNMGSFKQFILCNTIWVLSCIV